ncbi:MAG: phage holin family protein [Bacteroidales bacterium]|nr:phage holin family protein [Bacteroidales bacterium]
MKFILKIAIPALAVWLTSMWLDDVTCEPWYYAIVVAIVLGIINMIVKPIVKLFALPINILTLGLFSLVINGLMVMLCAHFVEAFTIQGTLLQQLGTAIIFSIVLSVVSWILNKLVD